MSGKRELGVLSPLTIGKDVVDFAGIKLSGQPRTYQLGSTRISVSVTNTSVFFTDNPQDSRFSKYDFYAGRYKDDELGEVLTWDIHTKHRFTNEYLEGFPAGKELIAHALNFLGTGGDLVIKQRWLPGSDNYEAFKQALPISIDSLDCLPDDQQCLVFPALGETWDAKHVPSGFVPVGVRGIRATDWRRYAKLGVEAIFRKQ